MKYLSKVLLLLVVFNFCACKQILIREYESDLDPEFFAQAECKRVNNNSFLYEFEERSFLLSETEISSLHKSKTLWTQTRSELYPHGYLEASVPYMLRDGMTMNEIESLLGKASEVHGRLTYYKLSDGAVLIILKGALEMPPGMKSLTIKDTEYQRDLRIPRLLK